ncbi:hypothetical protein BSKO_03928 [Bryopsis sp. KO-2023]|nr:hypothetical protein BSKO_03928 [Bryopsis sp. KO-2023]
MLDARASSARVWSSPRLSVAFKHGFRSTLGGRRFSTTCAATTPLGDIVKGKVVVVGAGIAGLATARALSLAGMPCVVLERDSGPRKEGASIGLWPNAWRALDVLGVGDDLREVHPVCDRVELRGKDGSLLNSFTLDECDAPEKEYRGVARNGLLQALGKSLPQDCIKYDVGVEGLNTDSDFPILSTSEGEIKCSIVVGCDGVRSPIAESLGLSPPNYAGYSAIRGVAEFGSKGLPVSSSTLLNYWGAGVRFGMYEIGENKLYWFVSFNIPESLDKKTAEQIKEEALEYAEGFDPVVKDCVAATPLTSLSRSKLGDRWMVPGVSIGAGQVTLCGDAMHPMTPNLGQGGCLALEDAVVLARTLKAAGGVDGDRGEVAKALREYESVRTKRVMPLMVQSNVRGALLQLDKEPVVAARDLFVKFGFSPARFLDPGKFDCGDL